MKKITLFLLVPFLILLGFSPVVKSEIRDKSTENQAPRSEWMKGKYGLMVHWNGSIWYLNQRLELGFRLSSIGSNPLQMFLEGNGLIMFSSPTISLLFNGAFGLKYTIN